MKIRHAFAAACIAIAASAPALALNIVIGNDDGCEASGVHALVQRLGLPDNLVLQLDRQLAGS